MTPPHQPHSNTDQMVLPFDSMAFPVTRHLQLLGVSMARTRAANATFFEALVNKPGKIGFGVLGGLPVHSSSALLCIALLYLALLCIVSHCVASVCFAVLCIVVHYFALLCIASHCYALLCIALLYLLFIALLCFAPLYFALLCNAARIAKQRKYQNV